MSTTLTWRFTIDAADLNAVPGYIDVVMEQMLLREGSQVHDTAIGLDLAEMALEISVTVEDPAMDGAVQRGMKTVQEALAAASVTGATMPVALMHSELIAV